jgi:hypothetical protein
MRALSEVLDDNEGEMSEEEQSIANEIEKYKNM